MILHCVSGSKNALCTTVTFVKSAEKGDFNLDYIPANSSLEKEKNSTPLLELFFHMSFQ